MPSARASVPDNRSRTSAHSRSGSRAAGPARGGDEPGWWGGAGAARGLAGSFGESCSGRVHLAQGRQVMHLVDHQQRAIPAELAQVQVGCRGHPLVGGDVAGEATAGIAGVVGGAHRQAVPKGFPPRRVGERFLGLQPQAVPRHHPADAFDETRADQGVGSQHRQQGLASTGRHGSQDVANLQPPGRDRVDQVQQALLMRPQWPRDQCRTGSRKAMNGV